MTTEQLGLLTTAAVGIAAAGGPFLTARLSRSHERAMVLYEQRRSLYRDLGGHLERQRMLLRELARAEAYAGLRSDALPEALSLAAQADLFGRAAVEASPEVQKER